MKWQARYFNKMCEGDIRSKQRFLFWPKCIQHEWRWLEHARWEEEASYDPLYPPGATFWAWRPTQWVD